jgi:putative aldouronate transport system substrate-binding protein
MNAKIKQTLALVLALVMCLGLLAGCAGKNDPTTKPTTKPVADPTGSSAAPQKNSDIYPLNTNTKLEVTIGSADVENRFLDEFWEGVTGVQVDWLVTDTNTMKQAVATDEFPDALISWSLFTKAQLYEYGKEGKFINYMDYLDYMPNVKAMFEKYPEALELVQNADGSVYSLPQMFGGAASFNQISIRNDMLEKAAWTKAPETTDELLQCLLDIKAAYKDVEGFAPLGSVKKTYMGWDTDKHSLINVLFPAFGESLTTKFYIDKNGKAQFGAASEQFKLALKYMNSLWEAGLINYDAYTDDGTVIKALALEGKVAAIQSWPIAAENFPSGKADITVIGPLTSTYYTEKHAPTNNVIKWSNQIINADCEDIETACRWMDSLYAPEENPLNDKGTIWGRSFTLGEYGVHYTVDKEAGTYILTEVDGIKTGNATQMVNAGACPGYYYFPYVSGDNSTGAVASAQVMQKIEPYRKAGSLVDMNVLALTEEENEIYTDSYAAINKYITEIMAQFVTGALNIDANWGAYLNELDVLGMNDVLEVYDDAYGRYLDAKK